MVIQRKNRKKCLAKRLNHSESQEDWPVRDITIANEDTLFQTACNYQRNRLSCEESFTFTENWNTSMSTLMEYKNAENYHYEDIRVSYDDGPCRNFGKKELTETFGCVPIEPSMDV